MHERIKQALIEGYDLHETMATALDGDDAGDGLAAFIARECAEVTSDEDDLAEQTLWALHALDRAVRDLQGVIAALERIERG